MMICKLILSVLLMATGFLVYRSNTKWWQLGTLFLFLIGFW